MFQGPISIFQHHVLRQMLWCRLWDSHTLWGLQGLLQRVQCVLQDRLLLEGALEVLIQHVPHVLCVHQGPTDQEVALGMLIQSVQRVQRVLLAHMHLECVLKVKTLPAARAPTPQRRVCIRVPGRPAPIAQLLAMLAIISLGTPVSSARTASILLPTPPAAARAPTPL